VTPSPLDALIRAQKRQRADALRLALLSAVVVGAASTLLLGLSGWFIVASAAAGAAGLATAHAFNVLLPSAMIRLLAILRTAARYGPATPPPCGPWPPSARRCSRAWPPPRPSNP
jgi:ATP-binding cassette subfamily C protein CydC